MIEFIRLKEDFSTETLNVQLEKQEHPSGLKIIKKYSRSPDDAEVKMKSMNAALPATMAPESAPSGHPLSR